MSPFFPRLLEMDGTVSWRTSKYQRTWYLVGYFLLNQKGLWAKISLKKFRVNFHFHGSSEDIRRLSILDWYFYKSTTYEKCLRAL